MQKPFNMYEGADGIPDERRMPQSTLRTNTAPRTVHELLHRLMDFTANEERTRARYPWASRFVLGYPLPYWQRPLVWTEEQKVKFITSLWMDVDVGSYLVNDLCEFQKVDGHEVDILEEFSEVLLDGQQRLSALESYWLGEFPVQDAKGFPVHWHELSRVERRMFGNKAFNRSVVHTLDEQELRHIYDLRAFGGTPHTADQRASSTVELVEKPVSALAGLPLNEVWIVTGKVLGIHFEGSRKLGFMPCSLLMEDRNGVLFEAWLANSTEAVRDAGTISEGDMVAVRGQVCKPILSHRDYGGLREVSYTQESKIAFMSALSLTKKPASQEGDSA